MTQEFAGALRERVAIEQRASQRDVWGGAAGGYSYDGAAWAAIAPLTPGEEVAGDVYAALPRWRVTLRRRDRIGPQTRFVWRGRYLKVRTVETDPAAPARMYAVCEEQR